MVASRQKRSQNLVHDLKILLLFFFSSVPRSVGHHGQPPVNAGAAAMARFFAQLHRNVPRGASFALALRRPFAPGTQIKHLSLISLKTTNLYLSSAATAGASSEHTIGFGGAGCIRGGGRKSSAAAAAVAGVLSAGAAAALWLFKSDDEYSALGESSPSKPGPSSKGRANAVVTEDDAYMEGIKLYGIGIKEDPVPVRSAKRMSLLSYKFFFLRHPFIVLFIKLL